MQCHKVDYEILGSEMQIVEVELDPGETVVAEAGAMNSMEDGIEFTAKMGDDRLIRAPSRVPPVRDSARDPDPLPAAKPRKKPVSVAFGRHLRFTGWRSGAASRHNHPPSTPPSRTTTP